ncbi:serine O-acetyltransferase [Microcoleus sp. herbarium8]|uniref:serine O-acetyltransferase n=1 Tax=Microcoleus sp. herbarium8 TaxID=3055436 RepID=UPI002FD41A9E
MVDANFYRFMLVEEIYKVFENFVPYSIFVGSLEKKRLINDVSALIMADLCSCTKRDPAARESFEYVISSYLSFKAVMYYRIANALFYSLASASNEQMYLQAIARRISEQAKLLTGIEIHPAASIGSGLVIDHGLCTLIGETCEIGKNCYLLQGVVLGAIRIADNRGEKRHPTLGNNVTVGAFAKILGDIKIGDNVEISPGSIVCKDIPSGTRVVVTTELQIHKINGANKLEVHGIFMDDDEQVCISGRCLKNADFYVCDVNHKKVNGIEIKIYEKRDNKVKIGLKRVGDIDREIARKNLRLSIQDYDGSEIVILNSISLKKLLELNE